MSRLKGVDTLEITDMCENIIKVFGLEIYTNKEIQKLR